jgi:hypothetical protein
MNELARRLPAIVRGDEKLTGPEDGAILARMCYDQGRHAAAVRLWAQVFAADPGRAEDREHPHRYNAACSAALASAGRTKDDPPPDEAARVALRAKAVVWLRAELTAWSKALDSDAPRARNVVQQALRHWKTDDDLAAIRDEAAVSRLAEDERRAYQALWADVNSLLKHAEGQAP